MTARPIRWRLFIAVLAALLFGGFFALGTWQVERRAWKLDLIGKVDQRAHSDPAAAPSQAEWSGLSAANDAYRRIRLTGRFLHEKDTLVQASTELGSGFWVMTPLQLADGSIVLVNRGFTPPEVKDQALRLAGGTEGPLTVQGLLRMSEPNGGFLRKNDAANGRWYSRDVAAIGSANGLAPLAPYFVDQDAGPSASSAAGAERWPQGGLTVIHFANNHLVYAITWYTLALMVAAAAIYVWRSDRARGATEHNADSTHSRYRDARD